MKHQITVGIEIEAVYNNKNTSINRGSYHNGNTIARLRDFKAEEDCSIKKRKTKFKDWACTIELVSRTFVGRSNFFTGLQKFIKYFSKDGALELNQVFEFNSSCGSHMHISIDDFKFSKKTIIECYIKTREYFINRILNSKIESRSRIIDNYDRDYAEKIKKQEEIQHGKKCSEFNFRSECYGRGIEWRSPNMTGIKTWEEFLEFWNIVYDSIQILIKNSLKWEKNFGEELIDIASIDHYLKIYKNNYGKGKTINLNLEEKRETIELSGIIKNKEKLEEIKCVT